METTGITIYGCDNGEAELFKRYSPHYGVEPTIIQSAVSENNASSASGNHCISVDHKTAITYSTLRALKDNGVAYITTRSIGCNHIDREAAEKLGIKIDNVAYSPDSVADYTLMLMLMAIRNAKSIINRVKDHNYEICAVPGRELRDMTVGVLGTGRIGQAVINRLNGFGCRILACDSYPKTKADYVPLDELLQQSDILTLHAPLHAGSYHILNRSRIERMKQGAIVINTARGSLIDTEALVDALEGAKLGGAALDVVEGEEGIFYHDRSDKPIHHRLLQRLQQLPNVMITPHTAFYTDHALQDIVENTLHNCLQFERGTK